MSQRKHSLKGYDREHWRQNNSRYDPRLDRTNNVTHPPNHSFHTTQHSYEMYNQHHYENRHTKPYDHRYSPYHRMESQITLKGSQGHHFDHNLSPRQDNKRSYDSLNAATHGQDVALRGTVYSIISSTLSTQVKHQNNFDQRNIQYHQQTGQPYQCFKRAGDMQERNDQHNVQYSGFADRKRRHHYMNKHFEGHLSKTIKVDYQQASTSFQSEESSSGKKLNCLPGRPFKQSTFIATLPYPAEGVEVVYTKDSDTAESWLQSNVIKSSIKEIGLDTEWRPQFIPKKKGGKENKISVIQLSTEQSCLVLHIFHMKEQPELLSKVLSDRTILKVGSGINGDVNKLLNDTGLLCDGRVDTQDYARALGIRQGVGLKNLSKQILDIDMDKPKSVSLSNWEYFPLKQKQINYAALDSWVSLKLYLKLKEQLDEENKQQEHPKTVNVHYGQPSLRKKKRELEMVHVGKGIICIKSNDKLEERNLTNTAQNNSQCHTSTSSGEASLITGKEKLNTEADNSGKAVKDYNCPIAECKRKFETPDELQEHVKIKHVACKVCGKLFKSKVSKKHKKQHGKS